MTEECLKRAMEVQAELNGWRNRKKAIELEADRISLTHATGIVHDSFDLNDEETQIIKEALIDYYNSKINPLEEEFKKI